MCCLNATPQTKQTNPWDENISVKHKEYKNHAFSHCNRMSCTKPEQAGLTQVVTFSDNVVFGGYKK